MAGSFDWSRRWAARIVVVVGLLAVAATSQPEDYLLSDYEMMPNTPLSTADPLDTEVTVERYYLVDHDVIELRVSGSVAHEGTATGESYFAIDVLDDEGNLIDGTNFLLEPNGLTNVQARPNLASLCRSDVCTDAFTVRFRRDGAIDGALELDAFSTGVIMRSSSPFEDDAAVELTLLIPQ
jgi:hypothetical protein